MLQRQGPLQKIEASILAWMEARTHRARLISALIGLALVTGLSAVLAAPDFDLSVGGPSPRDFEAPFFLTYTSEILTGEARERQANQVSPVYALDPSVTLAQINRVQLVMENISMLRESPEPLVSQQSWLIGFPELARLSPESIDLVLGAAPNGQLDSENWVAVEQETVLLVKRIMERQDIADSDLPTIRRGLAGSLDPAIEAVQARLIADLAAEFIAANRIVDESLTEANREEARANAEPVEVSYQAGQTIVRVGENVSPVQMEALAQFDLLPGAIGWRRSLSLFLTLSALTAGLAALLSRLRPDILDRPRPLALGAAMILIVTMAARVLAGAGSASLLFALPAAAVAMMLTLLVGIQIGIVAALLLAPAIGTIQGAGVEQVIYILVGSLAGSIVLDRMERMREFGLAGLAVAAANLAVLFGVWLASPQQAFDNPLSAAGVALAQALLATGITALGVLAAGSLFGVVTSFQLLELVRPNAPLLRELQLKAPGTYQHSIVLSNLAEAAASAIGADPLLVRAGALYHDVGKTRRPSFFVENQLGRANPHEGLDPYTSARIIIDHVADGDAMAREHGVPLGIRDFILEHHGTTDVAYFLHQARERAGEAEVDASRFRYPGPRPRSRETAILMLADGSEAAVRARDPQSTEEIDEVVRGIIQARLSAGQLEDSDLTLRDLRRIRRAFVSTLKSMYHPRIRYPEGVQPSEPRGDESPTLSLGDAGAAAASAEQSPEAAASKP